MLKHEILEKIYMNERMQLVGLNDKFHSVRAFTEVIENIANENPTMPIEELIDEYTDSSLDF